VEHLEGDGRRFFELACEQDLEGVICKPKPSYLPVYLDQGQKSQLFAGCRRKEWFDRMLSER
jgi:ATP-dependent DNA ligase